MKHPHEPVEGGEALVLIDDQGRCAGLTAAAAQMLKVQAREAEGRLLSDLLPSANPVASGRWSRASLDDLHAELGEYRTLDGCRFAGRCSRIGSRTVLHLFSVAAHEETISPAADERHRAEEVIAELAHELRGPLSVVTSSVALLRRSQPAAERELILDRLERQALFCLRLIENLLEVARVMSGRLPIHAELLDLGRLVEDSVESVRERGDRKRHRIEVTVPAGALVEADRARLQQVLVNLLSNAISYTDDGGTIAVAARTIDDAVEIRVRDSGRGVARERLPHLFERSVSIDCGGTDEKHLGVGLPLVRRIVELHGGSVSVWSLGVGLGTEFCVTLPGRAV